MGSVVLSVEDMIFSDVNNGISSHDSRLLKNMLLDAYLTPKYLNCKLSRKEATSKRILQGWTTKIKNNLREND